MNNPQHVCVILKEAGMSYASCTCGYKSHVCIKTETAAMLRDGHLTDIMKADPSAVWGMFFLRDDLPDEPSPERA